MSFQVAGDVNEPETRENDYQADETTGFDGPMIDSAADTILSSNVP